MANLAAMAKAVIGWQSNAQYAEQAANAAKCLCVLCIMIDVKVRRVWKPKAAEWSETIPYEQHSRCAGYRGDHLEEHLVAFKR